MDQVKKRVVVCGGGVIGVCTAYFLSKKGAAVTLIEQSSIACAASGKAAGFLALEMLDNDPVKQLARASFILHRSLAKELDGPQSYGYRPLTTLTLSINESEAPPEHPIPDVPLWLDGPAKSPKVIATEETSAQVDPILFCQTVMSRAVDEYGAKVVIGKMERVAAEGGGVAAVVLEGGEVIEADAVVLALGPWSGSLPLLSSIFRVSGFKAHSIVLEPKEPDVFTPHAFFLSYFTAQDGRLMTPGVYPRPTGEVYVFGMQSESEGEIPEDPEEIKPEPELIQVTKEVAKTVSSHLRVGEGGARVKAEYAGFLPYTDDKVPVIGKVPGLKDCYVATGHVGWGINNGPATGAALAELVLDGRAAIVDLAPFSPDRFLS